MSVCVCLCVLCGNSVTQPTALPTGKRTDCVANCCGYFALSSSSLSSSCCCLVNSINVCEREQECGHKTSTLLASRPTPTSTPVTLCADSFLRSCGRKSADICANLLVLIYLFTLFLTVSTRCCCCCCAVAALSLRCSSLLVDNYTKTCSICHKA